MRRSNFIIIKQNMLQPHQKLENVIRNLILWVIYKIHSYLLVYRAENHKEAGFKKIYIDTHIYNEK